MNDGGEVMNPCSDLRLEFLDLLQGTLSPDRRAYVVAHAGECLECARELQSLREAWDALPEPTSLLPSPAIRRSALAYARTHAREREGSGESPLGALWEAVRGVMTPVAVGAGATAILVLTLHLRGAMAPLDHMSTVLLSLALAAAIALASAGLLRGAAPHRVQTILLGGLWGVGGYLVLSLINPIPDTVQICRVAVFRAVTMSLGQVCLVYLGVAMLYAAVPMALATYLERPAGADSVWRTGLAEAVVFTLLAAPTLILQLGMEEKFITLTALAGLPLGALVGGLGGTWARGRGGLRAVGS